MRFILCFIFFIAMSNISAHDIQSIDSLKNEIKIASQDTNVIKLYIELGDKFENNLPESALVHYKNALNVSEQIKSNKFIAKSLNKIGRNYLDKGDYNKAVDFLLQSLEKFNVLEDVIGISKCLRNIGNAYINQGDYSKAMEYYQRSSKICEESGNKLGLASCYNNIGNVHYYQDNLVSAIEYYQKSAHIKKSIGDKKGLSGSYSNIGGVFFKQEKYDQALKYFKKSVVINRELDNKRGLSKGYNNIGLVYKIQGKYILAIEYYQKSLVIKEAFGDKNGIALVQGCITSLYLVQADSSKNKKEKADFYKSAVKNAEHSLEIIQNIGALPRENSIYEDLSHGWSGLKDYKKAYYYLQKFISTKDSLFNNEKIKIIAEMLAKYDSEKKEKENELLRKDNEIQILALEKQTTLRNFFIVLTVLVLLSGVFIYNQFIIKKKANLKLAEKNDLITTQKEQLKRANATKDKFLKIIHHDLLNPFTAIHSTAELLDCYYDKIDKQKRREYIKLMLTGSNNFLNLMNNLFEWVKSHTGKLEFKPESISLLDVISEELQVQEIFADKKEITITVNVPNTMNVFADRNMLRTVFRNLVSNAIKFTHNNGNINIKSRKLNDFIEIEITDTGIGINSEDTEKIFDVNSTLISKGTNDEKGTGFGLALCKEFIEINNGKILVKSELGSGCTILFTLPSF